MGNRAVITTPERKIGLYLHWNGGRDTIEPLMKYCELQGYRSPEIDGYGFARMAQVMGNFLGGILSVGIVPYTDDSSMDPGDNGIYVIENWLIIDRLTVEHDWNKDIHKVVPFPIQEEQQEYDFDEMIREFDKHMPKDEQLGELLDAVRVNSSELEIGDQVFVMAYRQKWTIATVIGFGEPGRIVNGCHVEGVPYVNLYGRNGYYSTNINNYLDGFVYMKRKEVR